MKSEKEPGWLEESLALSSWPFGAIRAQKHWEERPRIGKYIYCLHVSIDKEEIATNYFDPASGTVMSEEELNQVGVNVNKKGAKLAGLVIHISKIDQMEEEERAAFRKVIEEGVKSLRPKSPIVVVEKDAGKDFRGRKGTIMNERKEFLVTTGLDFYGNEKEKRIGFAFDVGSVSDDLLWLARTRAKPKRKPVDMTEVKPGQEGWKPKFFRRIDNLLTDLAEENGLVEIDRSQIDEYITNTKNPPAAMAAYRDGLGRTYESVCGCQIEIDTRGYEYLTVDCGDDECRFYATYTDGIASQKLDEDWDFDLERVEEIAFGRTEGNLIIIGKDEDIKAWCGDCPGSKGQRRFHTRKKIGNGVSEVSYTIWCSSCGANHTGSKKVKDSLIVMPD